MRLDVKHVPRAVVRSGQTGHAAARSKVFLIVGARAKQIGLVFLAVTALVLAFAGLPSFRRGGSANDELVYYTVTRADLPITVTEKGNLESQVVTEIRCDVENISSNYSRTGAVGTQILSIVENGKTVKKGELLVELDSAPLKDRLDDQELSYARAEAAKLQADTKLENQISKNATELAQAELNVKLADLALKMYKDTEGGTYQIALQELDLKVKEAKNKIREAQAGLLMQETNRNGIKTLYDLGYRGRGDLDQAVYKLLQAEDEWVRADNSLANAKANRRKLEQYEHPMKELTLQSDLDTARQLLEQVKRDNYADLETAKAAQTAADRVFEKEKERLDDYREQLDKCIINAPHDGMAVYATERSRYGSSTNIGEGEFVRQRQKILTLPDLNNMQVKTAIHESVLDKVSAGLSTTIQIDARPDRTYLGTIESVAVLPDPGGWLSSDIKVYETIVTIDEEVEHLKPGMTAVVEIHVDRLEDVLSVPVQAIVQVQEDSWCYVDGSSGPERRAVELGASNDKFVEVCSGLKEGEQVLLNPPELFDQSQVSGREISPDKDASEKPASAKAAPKETAKRKGRRKKQEEEE